MKIYTLTTIERRDADGAVDRYHGKRIFDVPDQVAAEMLASGDAVRVDWQDQPIMPEPEPAAEEEV